MKQTSYFRKQTWSFCGIVITEWSNVHSDL